MFQDSKFPDNYSHIAHDCFGYYYQLIQNRFQLRSHFAQEFVDGAQVGQDKGTGNLVLDHHRNHFQIRNLSW